MTRILLITLMVFFVPSLILGMISPVVIKLTVVDLEQTGNVVGKIYAFSTLGSILGTFATGFFLIEAMGTRTILYGVGAVLVLCAPIFGRVLARHAGARRGLTAGCLALMGAVLGLLWMERAAIARPFELRRDGRGALTIDRLDADTFFKESSYYTLKVYDDRGTRMSAWTTTSRYGPSSWTTWFTPTRTWATRCTWRTTTSASTRSSSRGARAGRAAWTGGTSFCSSAAAGIRCRGISTPSTPTWPSTSWRSTPG